MRRPTLRRRAPWLALASLWLVVGCGHPEPDTTARNSPEAQPAAQAQPADQTENAAQAGVNPAAPTCGKTGLPDCPLQAWMKATVQTSLKSYDGARLASSLGELARVEPHGYTGWAELARTAAAAAQKGDFERVRAECKSCHDQFRPKFRAEMRLARLL